MDDNHLMSLWDLAVGETDKSAEDASADLLGDLHKDAEKNAAKPQTVVNLNAIGINTPVTGTTIAGPVETHQLREKVFDDTEAKVVQGRLWLISFTDLFSLMLCFFLMLYSMKDPNDMNAPKLTGAHLDGMHGGTGTGEAGTQAGQNISRVGYGDGLNLDYLQGVLKDQLAQVHLENDVRIGVAKDHLNLIMSGDELFSGDALSADGQRIVKGLANRLGTLSNRITVAGVSDSGNWAGALAQATAFSELLHDAGYRKPFVVVGEGTGSNTGIQIRVDADDGNTR